MTIHDERNGCTNFDDTVVSRDVDNREDEFSSVEEYACGCVKTYIHERAVGCKCRDTFYNCNNCKLGAYRKGN